jgi:hypothetical protein
VAILLAVISLILAFASIYSLVPRIRLVEGVGLFATAFGAGASFAAAALRRGRAPR